MVPAATCAATGELHRLRVGLYGIHQGIEGLVLGVLANGNDAVIGTERTDPGHHIGVHTGELPLGEAGGGGSRRGNEQLIIVGPLAHRVRIGDAATGARHVDGLHTAIHKGKILQHVTDTAAGKIPTAAGIGRGKTFHFPGGLPGHGRHGDGRSRHERQGSFDKHDCHLINLFL